MSERDLIGEVSRSLFLLTFDESEREMNRSSLPEHRTLFKTECIECIMH